MSPATSNLIAGLIIVFVGIVYLVLPAIKQFKEQDPEVSHLRLKHWLLSIMTIMVGLLIASNRGDEVIAMVRRFTGSLFGVVPS